ncbi:TIGR00282 family metallophosphoesterase [Mycoplasma sp. Ms02]|uniref:TIGR00282 family metallophosphoesterase n=1 Tax=Mycoplasma sp. Ms02 TaxID=353851 RepID=UPI001C89E6BA|nr:TIGR00282 family metallophosphoesterase [Mycoplasma sp. Ms02]QZE12088.1 YmdB family metallophosphoesterase [Mycoplasma sp. Ms02]
MNYSKANKIKILFIGDIFGEKGIEACKKVIPYLKNKHKIDFIIAQGENVSGRKGLNVADYQTLKELGINAITMGNHVWANSEIYSIIDDSDIIRPANISNSYPGVGSKVFDVKGQKLRVTSIMGITFNKLFLPWKEEQAENFFDAIDEIISVDNADYHFVDFHGETTSEKYVFSLYVDGKVDALVGTHTHVQTNDAQVLPQKTQLVSDAGMTGPYQSAIGANFDEVYERMRFERSAKFKSSDNDPQFNGVIFTLSKSKKPKPPKLINYNPQKIQKI